MASIIFQEQVENLMNTLKKTSPHFIRCIVPNEQKKPGFIEAKLVMTQLTCNGVLEGIRICRKGFPNRMTYKEFQKQYIIVAAREMALASSSKEAASICMNRCEMDDELYRLGHTKVFFRAGALGIMEEFRDERIRSVVCQIQANCRQYSVQKDFKEMLMKRRALLVCQNAIRTYMKLRLWLWGQLWKKLKPVLKAAAIDDRIKELEEKIDQQKEQMKREETQIAYVFEFW